MMILGIITIIANIISMIFECPKLELLSLLLSLACYVELY